MLPAQTAKIPIRLQYCWRQAEFLLINYFSLIPQVIGLLNHQVISGNTEDFYYLAGFVLQWFILRYVAVYYVVVRIFHKKVLIENF